MSTQLQHNIRKFYLFESLSSAALSFPLPVIVLFWQANGLSLTQVMLLQSIFALAVMALELPSGYFADRLGRKRAILASAGLGLLGVLIYMTGDRFSQFVVAELVFALGIALLSGADSALFYDTLADLEDTAAYQKLWGNAIFYSMISMAVANAIGGFIGKFDLRAAWYPALATALLALAVAATFQEPRVHKTPVAGSHAADLWRILKVALFERRRLRWLLIFSGVVHTFTQSGLWFYQPYFQLTGLDIGYFGLIFAAFNLVAALSSKQAHRLESWLGSGWALLLLVMALSGAYLLMSNVVLWFSFIFVFFHQFVRGFARVILNDYVNRLTTSDIRATVLSVQSLLGRLLYAALIPGIGWLADGFGLRVALGLLGVAALVIGGAALFPLRRAEVL